MSIRGLIKPWARALALAAAVTAGSGPAVGAEPLRFCADPDNLPFSKSEGPDRGLYVEVAELVAEKLGRPIEWVWWYTHNQRRALRNTVGDKSCDVVVALPADYRARVVAKTQPFVQVGYAVVAAPGFTFKSLDDLRSKRIGVQFGSTPHVLVNALEGFRSSTYKEQDEIFAALAKGDLDAAFLWGPAAGWENKTRHGGRWQITPVAGHDLSGAVGMGVRRDLEALVAPINAALAALAPQIAQRAEKYAFPSARPIELAHARVSVRSPLMARATVHSPLMASASVRSTLGARAPAVRVPQALVARISDGADAVKAGRMRFNDQCSHCHGADGFSPIRERDLRRLVLRHDKKWQDVALTAIKNGRNDQGMPAWKDILKEPEILEVMAFLKTIQR